MFMSTVDKRKNLADLIVCSPLLFSLEAAIPVFPTQQSSIGQFEMN